MSGHLEPVNHTVKPTHETVEIVKLYPGETIKAILFAVKRTGEYSAKHAPCHAFHRPVGDKVHLTLRCHQNQDPLDLIDKAVKTISSRPEK